MVLLLLVDLKLIIKQDILNLLLDIQELVSMIVSKAANMADMMNIPVLGIAENMSYVLCPDCGRKIYVFGEEKVNNVASEFGYDVLGSIPNKNIKTV